MNENIESELIGAEQMFEFVSANCESDGDSVLFNLKEEDNQKSNDHILEDGEFSLLLIINSVKFRNI